MLPLSLRLLVLLVALAACAEPGPEEAAPVAPAAPPAETTSASGEASAAPADTLDAVHRRLIAARDRYREIARSGGWPSIPDGDLVRPGDRSPQVPPLRVRLRATGDLPADAPARRDSLYDDALAAAVVRFQERHGLMVDSLVGADTRAALNVPAEARLRRIERALDRWEPLPDSMGRRYVVVNVPEFRLRAFEDGRERLQMRVVVGQEYDGQSTPVFDDVMEHLIFRPYWNVPHSIATEEILPEARRDLDHLARNDYEIVSHYAPDAEVLPPTYANLDRVERGDLRLRQRPGETNALGLVKFMFPNEHAIYLHDTPADHLFAQSRRAASHGCIRVERPVDLAAWVLQGQPEWDRARIEAAMHGGERRRIDLAETVPVYVVYWTVYADEEGAVFFSDDLYGRYSD